VTIAIFVLATVGGAPIGQLLTLGVGGEAEPEGTLLGRTRSDLLLRQLAGPPFCKCALLVFRGIS